MTLRTGHLFAGAGGGLYADLILGHTPVFAVEWDDYAAGCLQRRADDGWFPGLHVHHGDVELFDPSDWAGRVDSIHAGFPCQDISVAGGGAGITGERSGLWAQVKRIARDIRPGELFLENSPAITSRGLEVVLGDLAELGYDTRWGVLGAAAVGAPHLRARWWCLAKRTNANKERRNRGAGKSGANGRAKSSHSCISIPDTDSIELRHKQKPIARGCNSTLTGNNGEEEPLANNAGVMPGHGLNDDAQILRKRSGGGKTGSPVQLREWWSAEPDVGRVANGVANRGNRIKCLGNGQVPLQAEAAYTILSAGFDAS